MKLRIRTGLLVLQLLATGSAIAQVTFPRNGVADQREGLYAFTHATIHTSWQEKMEDATLLIRKGKVEEVGRDVRIPADAVVVDAKGKTIYPSFIDLYTEYGIPEQKSESRAGGGRGSTQHLTGKKGAYAWNEALKPEFQAHSVFQTNEKDAVAFRNLGFGAVLTHRMDGIDRGTSALVSLGSDREHEAILREKVGHHLSFRKGSSSQSYPSSLMGAVALLRQTYLDAAWYRQSGGREETNLSLEAWNEAAALRQFFEAGDKLDVLRAIQLGEEFGVRYTIKGNGDEYQRLEAIRRAGCPLVLPVNFPAAYDVADPYEAAQVRLADMKHWELAPSNAARVQQAGIPFALTTADLARKDDFWPHVRKAVSHGLSEEAALKALTWTPAELAGALDQLGSLEKGKWASFLITDGDIFSEKTRIFHNWVKGKPFVLKSLDAPDLAGQYGLFLGGAVHTLQVEPDGDGFKLTIKPDDTTEVKVTHQVRHGRISLSFRLPGQSALTRLSGVIGKWDWKGSGQDAAGNWVDWSAQRVETESAAAPEKEKRKDGKSAEEPEQPETGPVVYPFTAFGWTEAPQAGTWLLRNATVWTNEAEGILTQADVLIRDGKIAAVGRGLRASDVQVVDATGRHITPGIIDEHTHIAVTRGVNEGTQASSAEVRIGDVLDSEDIDIYRQLSGGVTCAQVLHGSANPIGGQSAVIKLRWGREPEELKYERASPFIKFALGENVKRSRSSSNDRFPDSRMGVAEVFEDHFTEARKYGERKRSGQAYRPDLELEALLEILEGKRFITCHSYVQSEINMLLHVAERHGFKVNTFTHILEGYKVADKMKAHGAGGSSFSDWWAYKYEVYEAIPHNGAIMHEQGVTVAFNSDDAEMARRLNQEAGKAVRFGGVSEEDALKFVTLNPARLLHIDAYTGSLAPGKDADVVIWSDHPLSVYAKADMTFVDGIPYFDREKDAELRRTVAAERHRLIQRMLEVKKEGGRTQRAGWRRNGHYHCDSDLDEGDGADFSARH